MYDNLSLLQQTVYFTFIVSFFAMLAGTVFFFSQKSELNAEYRQTAILSGVITLVASLTYYFMQKIYLENATMGTSAFPTQFRYIDWFITVPLMLIKFPALLGMGSRGVKFMGKLVICSLFMLSFSFAGELNIGNNALHFGLYGISVGFWVYIIYSLYIALNQLPDSVDDYKKTGIRRMFLFILIGWVIYPIGYILPSLSLPGDYRELLYNVGDVINKVGLGLVVINAGLRSRNQ
ncbi:MAG: bacteriorhodopsin [Akkermansiaceae bacterium]